MRRTPQEHEEKKSGVPHVSQEDPSMLRVLYFSVLVLLTVGTIAGVVDSSTATVSDSEARSIYGGQLQIITISGDTPKCDKVKRKGYVCTKGNNADTCSPEKPADKICNIEGWDCKWTCPQKAVGEVEYNAKGLAKSVIVPYAGEKCSDLGAVGKAPLCRYDLKLKACVCSQKMFGFGECTPDPVNYVEPCD
jgi:hypothetical protein